VADLADAFDDRVAEVDAYLDLIAAIETAAASGPPRIGDAGAAITAQHQRILCSTVFLHLYNLVEATVTDCLQGVTRAAVLDRRWRPADLSEKVMAEWVRVIARTHVAMGPEARWDYARILSNHLVEARPVETFDFERGGGGSWDDKLIEKVVARLGLTLRIPRGVRSSVRRKFRDDMEPMKFVMKFRNRLSHGEISFSQGGENVSVVQLRELKDTTVAYLRAMVGDFEAFIAAHEFLREDRRPA
jgi:hypothetical protein